MDLEHPGDPFRRSFSSRTSFSDEFESISMILDDPGLYLGVLGSARRVPRPLWDGLTARM